MKAQGKRFINGLSLALSSTVSRAFNVDVAARSSLLLPSRRRVVAPSSSFPLNFSSSSSSTTQSSTVEEEEQTPEEYVPPRVWKVQANGGKFANVNRPTAGAQTQKELPIGKHPLQLYSLGTPNGQKVTIMLEELLELGISEAEYDAWLIKIFEGDQFWSGFVHINPNSKIPALVDHKPTFDKEGDDKTVRVFESASILLYLAEKFGKFIPQDPSKKVECMNWVFWAQGSAPFVGGGFGHFFTYAPKKFKYPIDRYTMETKRQLDVLNQHLEKKEFMVGDEYTIADMVIWPWYGLLVLGKSYEGSAEFLNVKEYPNVQRWAQNIMDRPAVQRGYLVNRTWGDQQLPERHDASDFDNLKEADSPAAKKHKEQ